MKEEIKSAIDKVEYAKWLISEIDFQERYHNHKEAMAWVITALYVPGIIYLGYSIHRASIPEWVVFGGIVFVSYLVGIFVKMQFDMRWEAADVVHILMRHMSDLNRGGELPREDEWVVDNNDVWPYFVRKELDDLKKERSFWKAFIEFWKVLLCGLWCKGLWHKEGFNRWKTEIPSYLLIILATLFAVHLAGWN